MSRLLHVNILETDVSVFGAMTASALFNHSILSHER